MGTMKRELVREKIANQLTNHRLWLASNGIRIEKRELRYLEGELAIGMPQACQSIADCLDGLATVYGIRGILNVVDGVGWTEISRAIDYWGWSLKLRAEGVLRVAAFKEVNLTNRVSRAACLACCSEAWSATAGTILRQVASEPHAVDPQYWAQRRFEPFVLACLDYLDGIAPPLIAQPRSPYHELLKSLEEGQKLHEALSVACDYHVENIYDTGGDWDPEFKYPPFDLLPCEVMIINTLNTRSGRPPIDGSLHPLIQTLGRSTRLSEGKAVDGLLEQISETFVRFFG